MFVTVEQADDAPRDPLFRSRQRVLLHVMRALPVLSVLLMAMSCAGGGAGPAASTKARSANVRAIDVPPAPRTAPVKDAPAAQAPRLKVLVLDATSSDLTESERATLTSLVATGLTETAALEVLSGADLRQLIALQAQATEIGVDKTDCTDACMAELAGALDAGVVVATQAGKLGEAFVVTLTVFDASKASTVSRKSLDARALGELPARIGITLGELIAPLVPASRSSQPQSAMKLEGRVKELYDAEAMRICVDEEKRNLWWFCSRVAGDVTENEFVRRYREATGANDLDHAEVNRAAGAYLLPSGLLAGSALVGAGMAGGIVCTTTDACGTDVQTFLNESSADGPNFIYVVLMPGMALALPLLITGIIFFPDGTAAEGEPQEHTLTEGAGLAGAARYNAALLERLQSDLGR